MKDRRLRVGIVGGGRGAFIGSIHRIAAELDGQANVIAGAMSSDPEVARASAAAWYLERSYSSFESMAVEEARHPAGIDFVIVATPNNLHLPVSLAFLRAGIHVVCDKPLACSVAEAQLIFEAVGQRGKLFALTHTYTGYPMVRQARAMVRDGKLGTLRKVLVEYNQDWLKTDLERQGNKQASWRTDPRRAGISCCVGDIGTHAQNLLEFISGRNIVALCADLSSFVTGRVLDDDANMLLRLEGGAKGTLVCSQVACGEENALNIRLYGDRGALEWHQQEPNTLIYKPADRPWEYLRTGQSSLDPSVSKLTRTPAGHPEGYLEAFATLYRNFIADVRRVDEGIAPERDYPTVEDGIRGLRFVEKAVESARRGAEWVEI
jgi:predicted dehydrogenase